MFTQFLGEEGLKNSNMSIAYTQNSIFNYSFVCFVKKQLKCLEFFICGPLECNLWDTFRSMLSLWTFIIKVETHFGCKSFLLPWLVHMSRFTFAWRPCHLHRCVYKDAFIFQASPYPPVFFIGWLTVSKFEQPLFCCFLEYQEVFECQSLFEYALQHGLKIIPKDCSMAFWSFSLYIFY